MIKVDKVYVVHVKSALDREKHMRDELGKLGIAFEFMLDGDISDLSEGVMQRYFAGDEMTDPAKRAIQSCAYKHLLIYEKMQKDGVSNALIFEDDVYLSPNFELVFNQSIDELKLTGKENKALINYENSTLNFIDKNSIDPDQVLYPTAKSRCAGAYYLSTQLAQEILEVVEKEKCHLPIDWYHSYLSEKIALQHYWCHPTLVEQGSHNGKMKSLLDDKKSGFFRRLSWALQKFYKQKVRNRFK